MKKKLLVFIGLVFILSVMLSIASVCYADSGVETVVAATSSEQDTTVVSMFSELWGKIKGWAIPLFGGLSAGTIATAIAIVIVKWITNKTLGKIDKKLESKGIADKVCDTVKTSLVDTTVNLNVVPVMTSQYKALAENINANQIALIKKQNEKEKAILEAIKKLGGLFDCSVAVTDEQRAEFRKAIEDAEKIFEVIDTKVVGTVETNKEDLEVTIEESKVLENY